MAIQMSKAQFFKQFLKFGFSQNLFILKKTKYLKTAKIMFFRSILN